MISHPLRNRVFFAMGVTCFLAVLAATTLAEGPPVSSAELLKRAAEQIDSKDYVGAKESLEQVKPAELTPADKDRLSYLILRTDHELAKATRVRQSIEQAEELAKQNDFVSARQTLDKALKSAKGDRVAEKMIKTKLVAIGALEKRFKEDMKKLFYKSIKDYDDSRLDQAEQGFKAVIDSGVDLGFWNRGKPKKYLQKIAKKKAKLPSRPLSEPEEAPITTIVVKPSDTTSELEAEPTITIPARAGTSELVSQRNQAIAQQELAEARAALAAKDFDKVLLHTRYVLAVMPDNAEAQEMQSQALRYVTPAASGQSLIAQEVKTRRILSERIFMQHQVAMDRAEGLVKGHKFDEARSVVRDAQDTIRTHRSILPADQMAQMNSVGQAKLAHIDQKERMYVTAQIEERQRQAENAANEALARNKQEREARVAELFSQGATFIKERNYKLALDRYRQVLTIDPNNKDARSFASWLQDQEYHLGLQDVEREAAPQTYETLRKAKEASIPHAADPPLIWDKGWEELSRRRIRRAAGISGESPENAEARVRLNARHPRFEYQDTPLSEVFDDLREKSGLNIVPNWQSLSAEGIEQDQTVNLNLRGVSVGRALKAILDGLSTGFYGATISYSLEDGVVAIASSMDLGRDFYTVVYDISDLLIEVTDRRGGGDYEAGGGQSQQGGGGGDRGTSSNQRSGSSRRSTSSGRSGEDAGEDREGLVERVVELITNVSPADTWQEEGTGEGTITVWGTRLVVNQTSENHTKIRDMLDQIRETRPVQISVEPRFIFVTDNFLEDIGIDLDFYLNPQGRWTGPDTRGFVVPPPIGTGFPGFRTGVPAPLVGIQAGESWAASQGTGLPGSLGGAAAPTALSIAGSFLDKLEVDFFLRATQASSRANTLMAPRVTFENGSGARIYVGREFHYIEDVDPTVEENAVGYDITVGILETGPTLDVMGVVSPDRRFVRLEIDISLYDLVDIQTVVDLAPSIADLIPALSLQQLPILDLTSISTQVSVPDGGALLIGGLKRKADATREVGVPILSKLPYIKRWFTNKSLTEDKHVLVILLRPRIIDLKEEQNIRFPRLGEQ